VKATLLYVTYDGLLEPLGASQILPYVKALAEDGLSVHVVSFEKAADRGRPREAALRVELEGLDIRWTALKYHSGNALLATGWDLLRGRRAVTDIAWRAPRAVLHARSYVAAAMALPASRRFSLPLVFDMRGFWIDERLESGRWRPEQWAVRPARRLERTLLREASALVHLSEAGREEVETLGPVTTPHQIVVPTCVDTTRFLPPEDAVAAKAAKGMDDRPVMLHAGTLSGWYMGSETLAAGQRFSERGGRFLVLTREPEEVTRLSAGGSSNPEMRTATPEEMPGWLAAADVGLALVRPTFSKRASMPTRVAEYLSSGLAVAATEGVGDLDRHFADTPVAKAFATPLDIEQVVDWSLAAAQAGRTRADQARRLAQTYYDLDDGVERLRRLYRTLGATW